MNILIYSSTYLPVVGGLQYFLFWLLSAFDKLLSEKKNEIKIYFFIPKYKNQLFINFKNITVIQYEKDFNGIVNKLKILKRLVKITQKKKIDLITCSNADSDGPLIMMLNKITNIPFTVTCQGEDIAYNKKFDYGARRDKIKSLLIRLVLQSAVAVSTISKDMSKFAVEAGANINNLTIIPNGIPKNFFFVNSDDLKKTREKYKISDKNKVILTLSGHRKIKGHFNLLEGFMKIIKKFPNSVLVIGAESPYTKVIKQKAIEIGIENSVRFVGFLNDKEKSIWFSIADVYANTAYFEPFGISYLEAIQNDCAVLGSFKGGGKDIFLHKESAYLVNPYSISSIENGISYLFNNKNKLKITKKASLLLSKYSMQKIAKLYMRFYKKSLI